MVGREQGRATCTSIYPLLRPVPEKAFLVSKFQLSNVKRCGVGGFDMLYMFVMLFCACET